MRKKRTTAQPMKVDVSVAVEVFMMGEVNLGKHTPSTTTTEFQLSAGREGGCQVAPLEYGYGYSTWRDVENWFKKLSEIAKGLTPRATAKLEVRWSTGGHAVAFGGRVSMTKSHSHFKSFKSPQELAKWKASRDGKTVFGQQNHVRWSCTITRV